MRVIANGLPSDPYPIEVRRLAVVATGGTDVLFIDVTDADDPSIIDTVSLDFVPVDLAVNSAIAWPDDLLNPIAVLVSGVSGLVRVIDLLERTVRDLDAGGATPCVACFGGCEVCLEREGRADVILGLVEYEDPPSLFELHQVPDGPGDRLSALLIQPYFWPTVFVSVRGDGRSKVFSYSENIDLDWDWYGFNVGDSVGRMAGEADLAAVLNEADDMGLGPGLEGSVSLAFFEPGDDEIARLAAPGARDLAFGPDGYKLYVPVRLPGEHELWRYDISGIYDGSGIPDPLVFHTPAAGGMPAGIGVSFVDRRDYLIDGDPATLYVIDTSGPLPEWRGSVEVPGASFLLAVQP